MPVSRRPKARTEEEFINQANDDVLVEPKVISELESPRNQLEDESDIQPLKLRVPRELVRDIDNLLSQRKPKISRHNWILEALYEKLERDSG
ncbi:hypothetical protein H6F98_01060 [Microcoleus sp. FACHB-SPT15]|uniref:hypothetical protein n=1 Tax=Microcoleus sp. FACHB-SPT15 TaxID=2692830 RepID=UPI001783A7E7|nr:hypothetical protein [Microcoleus sp. FACHB-SPT15]MBD1804064.1 hypothetical protein [Microcoleus sp. FACHB-SPT15]